MYKQDSLNGKILTGFNQVIKCKSSLHDNKFDIKSKKVFLGQCTLSPIVVYTLQVLKFNYRFLETCF